MSKSQIVQNLDTEIEEMEARFAGPTDDSTPSTEQGADGTTPNEDDLNPEDATTHTPTDFGNPEDNEDDSGSETEDQPTGKKKYTDWKSRYKSLRSHHDATIYDLRQELASLKATYVDLHKKNIVLVKQLEEKVGVDESSMFTDEEREVLGVEAIQALQKATRNAVEPLKRQLDEERDMRVRQQEASAKRLGEENRVSFISRFSKLVPNYQKIDSDQNFLKYMAGIDPASGYDRTTLFQRAVSNGDVSRAAEFYKDYLKRLNPLDSKITPTGVPGNQPNTSGNKEIITKAFIDQFYNDIIKGKYRGKDSLQRETEAKIDRAVLEGRIR
jgi:hypothetical protein